MWLDLIALVIVLGSALAGAFRGTLISALRLFSIVLAYAAAIYSAPRFGPAIAERYEIADLLGMAAAGSLAFFATAFAMGILGAILKRLEQRRLGDAKRDPADRLGGAFFSALRGSLIVLLLGWLGLWVDAAHEVAPQFPLPKLGDSVTSRFAQVVLEVGVETLVSDDHSTSRMVKQVAVRPVESVQGFQSIFENSKIRALRDDAVFWSDIQDGNVNAAMSRESFHHLALDAQLRLDLANTGLISQEAAQDPLVFKKECQPDWLVKK